MLRRGGRPGWVAGLVLTAAMAVAGCADHAGKTGDGADLPDDPPCPPAEAMRAATESAYARDVQRRFYRHAFYPEEAIRAGQAGTVILCVRLERHGNIEQAGVLQSSGFPMLDGAALMSLGLLGAASELEWAPRELASKDGELWLALQVNFEPPPGAGVPRQAAPAALPCHGAGHFGTVPRQAFGAEFLQASDRAIQREMRYPREATTQLAQGESRYCIAIDRDSKVLDASIKRSSGSLLLDATGLLALGLVQFNAEMPALPAAARQDEGIVELLLPVNWEIPPDYAPVKFH